MIIPIINQPRRCRKALAGTNEVIVLDLETEGLTRHDRIVSVGLIVDGEVHILFVRSRRVANISVDQLRQALAPLTFRKDLTVAGHTVNFDIGMLNREGIVVAGKVRDTELVLRLLDQDRGRNKDVFAARLDRKAPPGSPRQLDYRLKHAVPQLLGVRMVPFDDRVPMAWLPYQQHVQYLTSDVVGTALLDDHLLGLLTPSQRLYHDRFVSPLIPILVGMTEIGVKVDCTFIRNETERLEHIMTVVSDAHKKRHGVALGMSQNEMDVWLFGALGLRPRPGSFKKPTAAQFRQGLRGSPSLDSNHLKSLRAVYHDDRRVVSSLDLILRYRRAASLLVGLRKLSPHVDWRDGRIHTLLRDTQATGRIASQSPNLQGIAKTKWIAGAVFKSRSALVASEGFELVGFDIKQADIRILANSIASFPLTAEEHLKQLRRERLALIGPQIQPYLDLLSAHRNPDFRPAHWNPPPTFDPRLHCALGEIFRRAKGDFYDAVASAITGNSKVSSVERDVFKRVTLGMVNSIGPGGLAKQLGYGEEDAAKAKAKAHMDAFWKVYPQVAAFTELMRHQVALTGETATWAGRTRTCTPHRWMVTLPRVEILISFKGGDWYWLGTIPLRPGRHVLTCWISKVWDASHRSPNLGKLIYDDVNGVLCTRPYRLFQSYPPLLFKLPVRNIAWRSIRRVRTDAEESRYDGFDSTARSLVNAIYQAGTADVSKTMMIRALPYCRWVGARLLLQIHDELLFEVPIERAAEFMRTMKRILELAPSPDFQIPILVDPKRGKSFGEMRKPARPR